MAENKGPKKGTTKRTKLGNLTDGEQSDLTNEFTKMYINPLKQIYKFSDYNGYTIFYLENGNGYNIGSLFGFPEQTLNKNPEDNSFSEMIVRQNISSNKYENEKQYAMQILPQFQKLINDVKETMAPVFMPLLPPKGYTKCDLQNLESDCFLNDNVSTKYINIYKQIENAFDMARFQIERITKKSVPNNWFLYGKGETSKGLFRLWSLCPQKTSAICCDRDIDKVVLPVTEHKKQAMSYPNGFKDYGPITGIDGKNPELLSKYRNTDVLYISTMIDSDEQKRETQMINKLGRLKFQYINLERFDGTKPIDFSYFFQYRSNVYIKPVFPSIKDLFKRIIHGKAESPLLLTSGNTEEIRKQSSIGPLSIGDMQVYQNNLHNAANYSSSEIAKGRLANTISQDEQLMKS